MRKLIVAGTGAVLTLVAVTGAGAAAAPAERDLVRGVLPAAPGTGLSSNHDGEPGVAAAPNGQLWATAFTVHDPRGRGQDIWTSRDGGRHWSWVAAPFNSAGQSVGGNDADVAVATARNSDGAYTVYVASLDVEAGEDGLLVGDVSLAVSLDGGRTWVVDPLAAEVPGDDRPWLTADGACRVYLTYHAGPTVATVVNTYDLCDPSATASGLTLTPMASTRYAALAVPAATGGRATYVVSGFSKPVLDRGLLVIPGADCPKLSLAQEVQRAAAADPDCPAGARAAVYVEVADPHAGSWALREVARTDNGAVPVWPTSAAVGPGGALYVAWTDSVDSWMSRSRDLGRHWSRPLRLNAPTVTAVYPTVAMTPQGVAAYWYQSDRRGDANDPARMRGARWSLAGGLVSLDVHHVGRRTTLDPIVHRGVLCTRGDACTIPGSRTLYDDFGAVGVGRSGRVSVVYTSDQPGGREANDAVRFASLRP